MSDANKTPTPNASTRQTRSTVPANAPTPAQSAGPLQPPAVPPPDSREFISGTQLDAFGRTILSLKYFNHKVLVCYSNMYVCTGWGS